MSPLHHSASQLFHPHGEKARARAATAVATAPASIECLQAVEQRGKGQVPVLFNSGLHSGQDAFAALACGATAVLLGRPYLWALVAVGPLGVAHVIRLMRDELEMIVALTGYARLADIGPHCLARF